MSAGSSAGSPAAAHRPDAGPASDAVRLADYRPPAWLIDETRLVFSLDETATRVEATLAVRRNPDRTDEARPDFRLDGRSLRLVSAEINGAALQADAFAHDREGLTVPAERLPGDAFTWHAVTEIDPKHNTALEGLYLSRDMFCTQCEAQGFRKITFYPDRPDVMSVFTTRIEGDAERLPVMLSNGNPVASGDLPGGRRFVEWRDPHRKPSYLFALVAGRLESTSDVFTTRSGRRVDLHLFTRPGDEPKAAYALDALKRSMRWDEEVYGREYDLDLFMIVAVDDFNMGAMENKGLNIFNSKYVLATAETATDRDYELIESVVAHEYFHNWTGNRITCRDWFQLCLKEGLTVFRDQQFTEDMRSAAVARIDSVKALRARQFREDAGPLAHPVRPESYVEINNFYTATVYEKGAEIVGMLRTLVGPELYREALDLYFERHDGQACTIEDFLACFEDAAGRDLSQFALWWRQAGTPRLAVEELYNGSGGVFGLSLRQSTPPTPGQPEKAPLVLPLRLGFLDANGDAVRPQRVVVKGGYLERRGDDALFVMTDAEARIRLEGLAERPVVSINRAFSAPIIVEKPASDGERAFLLAHDSDPFNRWEAGRALAVETILRVADDVAAQRGPGEIGALVDALGTALADPTVDPAFKALLLTMPGDDELAGEAAERRSRSGVAEAPHPDPDAIHAARTHVRIALATALGDSLLDAYRRMATPGPYRPTAADAGKRALKNAALALLAQRRDDASIALAETQFARADNMTDQLPALTVLVHIGAPGRERALAAFYDRWKNDALVLGKWFGVQATSPLEDALAVVAKLTDHPAFEWRNPNKFRALIGAFAMGNFVNFHRRTGEGYRFFGDWLMRLDPVNPQTAAKLVSAFESWRRYGEERQRLIRAELECIRGSETLSRDMAEMVDRMLSA